MEKVAIAIPIYKSNPSVQELKSLKQLQNILGKYPKAIITHKAVNLKIYYDILGYKRLQIFNFPSKFFRSLAGYNHLMKSMRLYEKFADFRFFLMYHPDAWVFRDELEEWCEKDYDYIGAPLYEYDGTISPPEANYICIGNGGFSLHKVCSAITVLNTFKRVYPMKDLISWYGKYNLNGKIKYLPYFLRILMGLGGNAHHRLNHVRVNEDIFWGKYVPKAFPGFRIASFEEAYRFSMEYRCKELLELNSGQLPFGTHQWYKGDFLNFWKPFILG